MATIKAEYDKNELQDAGWVVDAPDLCFYSRRGRDTMLKATCQMEGGPIEHIVLRIFGREIGRVYSQTTGFLDLGLLESKLDIFSTLDFKRAIKPLL